MQYLNYYNYGGDHGEDVYDPTKIYYRKGGFANYLECYHKGVDCISAFISAHHVTPEHMGVTFELYPASTLEMDTSALLAYLDEIESNGIKLGKSYFGPARVVHFLILTMNLKRCLRL